MHPQAKLQHSAYQGLANQALEQPHSKVAALSSSTMPRRHAAASIMMLARLPKQGQGICLFQAASACRPRGATLGRTPLTSRQNPSAIPQQVAASSGQDIVPLQGPQHPDQLLCVALQKLPHLCCDQSASGVNCLNSCCS